MNNAALAQAVRKAAKPKFYGHRTLKSKIATHFPENLAREYMRIANAYMTMLHKTLKEHLPDIRKAIAAEREEQYRHDDDNSVMSVTSQAFMRIIRALERKSETFGLDRKLKKLADLNRKLSVRQWKRVVHNTLGLDIHEDYYMGELFQTMMKVWTQNNIDLIKTVEKDTLSNMRTIVEEGYRTGKSNTAIGELIQEEYGIERRRAQFIARDQVAKLNSDLTQTQQQDAGVEEYVWSSSGDVRVRDCHQAFDGKKFKWSDPPMNWYDTKSRGRVDAGRYHPGQGIGCRCVALPVFNIEGLSLPWEKRAQEQEPSFGS